SREGGAAGRALPAAGALLALQGRGEGPGRGGAAGAGRTRDQPGLGEGPLRGGGAAELRDRRVLAHDVGPHPGRVRGPGCLRGRGHCSSLCRGGGTGSKVGSNRLSTSATEASTSAWTSSRGRVPSTTA